MAKRQIDWHSRLFPLWPFLLFGFLPHGIADADWSLMLVLVIAGGVFAAVYLIGIYHWHEITDTALVIHAGPFGQRVPLAAIFDVAPTCDGVPASRNAIRVRYYTTGIAGDSVIIFAHDGGKFIGAIADRCPQLEHYGTGLRRTMST
jgi:hypothetical protein